MQRKKGRKNRIEHTKLLCLAGVLCAACFLCACTKREELLILTEETAGQETAAAGNGETAALESADLGGMPSPLQEEAVESAIVYVHVCGAVEAPGVYELSAGSRVYEAIQAAGGFSEDAEQSYVNQAQMLSDGMKLVIPTVEEAAGLDASAWQANTENVKRTDGTININTATKQELCTIPGVGETRAAAIISYRESHGGFTKPEDIMKVNGIKEGMYEKIKDSISVN